ncbi:MAG: 8-amino-7-oxononanoate synthase [Gammaproteobacteria bacterium]|nr:8-amino-7-oxononanoate synthase [Gammaproteobacteria bacterium]
MRAVGRYRAAAVPPPAAIDFSSNDYLGLRRHPALAAALAECAARDGVGAGAAHLVSGHHSQHAALEAELAAFTGRERALLFGSGYLANLGVLSALVGRGDLILQDRLNHASLLDGALLARARLRRYAHADATAAATLLADWRARVGAQPAAAIATDGVFSMDGDLAPLPALAVAARAHRAWLIVDDAHALGVLGATGRGSCEHYGLDSGAVPLVIGTLGKAFGTYGAFVAGERDVIEWIVQRARTYIYTTALPPPVAAATRAALRIAQEESWRRARLNALVQRFRARCASAGLPLPPSPTPIQPLLVGSATRALQASDALLARGFVVKAIRAPTVPAGTERLRISLSAAHDEAQVDRLCDALVECIAGGPA